MAHWTITLEREGATIIVRGEGDDPHAPDRIDYDVRGSPGQIYRELLERIRGGPWSFQADRMHSERDLSWIAGCARTEALLHPGWSVKTEPPRSPRRRILWGCNPVSWIEMGPEQPPSS